MTKKAARKGKAVKTTAATASAAVKKPHRWRPGTVARRETRKWVTGKKKDPIAKAPFSRKVRSIATAVGGDLGHMSDPEGKGKPFSPDNIRFTPQALDAFREYIISFMQARLASARIVQRGSTHRVTLKPQDLRVANAICDMLGGRA